MSKAKKKLKVLLAVCSLATVFQQVLPSGCAQYGAYTALTTFDFCAVLNCTGGTYFNLCSPVVVLVDCP